MVSPTAPACVAQDDLEPLLLEHLLTAPHSRVELGSELAGIFAGDGGARASLRDVRTGALSTVHARYVVAADGARSAVRRALGISMIGPEGLLEGYTTLFHAPLWEVVGERRHPIYSVTHEAAPGSFIPAGPSDRWLHGVRDSEAPDERRAAELIRLGAGVPDLPVRVERSRQFSSAAQLAERWRSGCIFLAGDAAHRVTPRGGTGLNLALHDGYDLGWRLGWLLRGWAPPALLDSYESRAAARRRVHRGALGRSQRLDPQRRAGGARRPRRPHRPRLGRGALDARPARAGADAVRRPRRAGLGTGGRLAQDPRADRRPAPRSDRRAGARRAGGAALLARSDGTPVAALPGDADRCESLRAAVGAIAA